MSTGAIGNKPKQKLRHGVFRMLLTLLAIYVLICAAGCALQRRLIYFPTKLDPKSAETMAARADFLPWKNESAQVIGWKLPANTAPTGSVLIIHGNAGCAIDRGYLAKPIHEAAHVDVYVLEYPGYGAREGSSSQKSFLAAGEEALALLDRNLPVYIVSESLGTGVAAHLTRTHERKIDGLALFVPYNNFAELAQTKMPFLPVSWILMDRYDPQAWLKDYDGPVKIILAENDEIIPAKFGRKLYDSFRGPKDIQIMTGAHHNDVCAQSSDWWKNVFAFWREHQKLSPPE